MWFLKTSLKMFFSIRALLEYITNCKENEILGKKLINNIHRGLHLIGSTCCNGVLLFNCQKLKFDYTCRIFNQLKKDIVISLLLQKNSDYIMVIPRLISCLPQLGVKVCPFRREQVLNIRGPNCRTSPSIVSYLALIIKSPSKTRNCSIFSNFSLAILVHARVHSILYIIRFEQYSTGVLNDKNCL